VMTIFTKADQYPFTTRINTQKLKSSSKLVEEKSGFIVSPNKAIVGNNAFRHGSGIHQDALIKSPENYEFFSPELVGRSSSENIVIGPHSGRNGINYKFQELGYKLENNQLDKVYKEIMKFGAKKKEFTDDELIKIIKNI